MSTRLFRAFLAAALAASAIVIVNTNTASGAETLVSMAAQEQSVGGDAVRGDTLQFDGQNDFVDLPDVRITTKQFTAEAWFNSDDLANCDFRDCRIISKADNTSTNHHYFMLSTIAVGNETRLRFRLKAGSATHTLIADEGDLVDDRWYHVAGTYDGSEMKLYLDGELVGSMPVTGRVRHYNGAPVWVGSNPPVTSSRPWAGQIDEVRLWTTSRTAAEIVSSMNTRLTGSETGLVTYLPFDASDPTLNLGSGSNVVLGSSVRGDRNDPESVIATEPTPAPTATPVPATPVPATPVPATPVPATPVPATPVPATPVPATPVPATPVPATPVPTATPVPATPVPTATPVPATPVPATPVPTAAPVTPTPAPTVTDSAEVYPPVSDGGFLYFDGTDDQVDLGGFDVTGNRLTIEAWVNANTFDNCSFHDCRIISKATGTAEQDHYWMLSTILAGDEDHLRFRLKTNGVTTTLIAPVRLESLKWFHVAATYDGGVMRLYVDGQLVGETAKTGNLDTNPNAQVWIGDSPSGVGDRPWQGSIDEVRIWDVGLGASAIRNGMTTELSGNENGLVAYLPFSAGQVAADRAGGTTPELGTTSGEDGNDPGSFVGHVNAPISYESDGVMPGDGDGTDPVDPSDPVDPVPPPSGPVPEGWGDAVATGDIWTVRGWYLENTGYESFYSDSLGRNLERSDLTFIDGPITITEPGTVIEGAYIDGPVTILADNVTIRGSIIDIRGYAYGVNLAGQAAGSNWTIDHVTFMNGKYDASQNYEDRANRPIYVTTSGTARFNQVLDGYSVGFYSVNANDQLWEYNFVDHIVRSPGSHNTSMNVRTMQSGGSISDITLYRNLFLDGTSAPLALYTDSTGLHKNVFFIENILDLPYTTSTWYCLYTSTSRDGHVYNGENVRFEGNIFGRSSSNTCGKGGPFTGTRGDVWAGNQYIDGEPVN